MTLEGPGCILTGSSNFKQIDYFVLLIIMCEVCQAFNTRAVPSSHLCIINLTVCSDARIIIAKLADSYKVVKVKGTIMELFFQHQTDLNLLTCDNGFYLFYPWAIEE